MGRSAAFARIKAQVLAIMRAVPPGRVVSFAAVGAHLDVAPRHVAYLLATLSDEEAATTPWWRAVSAAGDPAKGPKTLGPSASERLAAEGAPLVGGRVAAYASVDPADLPHGVPAGRRP
jgi:methylated-DNA-protein-cysteine methyltransferase-like protein